MVGRVASLLLEAIDLLLSIGIYSILFMICAYIILRRRHNIHWIIQVLGLALYILASADIAYTMWLVFGKLLKGDVPYADLRVKYWLYVTNRYVL